MRIPTPTQVETAGWLLLCGGLAAIIAIEVAWGRGSQWHPDETPAVSSEFPGLRLSDAFSLPSADALPETTLRPIFVVTRRPAPIPPPATQQQETMKRGQFILTGVSITPDGKFAFLVEKSANKTHVVALGKTINGIAVSDIMPDRIVLTQHDDSEVLLLVPIKGTPATSVNPASQPRPRGILPRQPDNPDSLRQ